MVPKNLEDLTEDQRAHLFRTELSSEREAGEEWEKELARPEKEEEDRRKVQALYRSERRAEALEHGREIQRQRQEEFLKWKAEEEDREVAIPLFSALNAAVAFLASVSLALSTSRIKSWAFCAGSPRRLPSVPLSEDGSWPLAC